MEQKIEVIDSKSTGVAAVLESLLVDEYVLSVRTRDARRNVNGRNITELRKLLAFHCKYLDGAVVDISRRARALGQLAPVTFAHSMEATRLGRHNEKLTGQDQIIEALLDDHESVIRALSGENTGTVDEQADADTAEFISLLLRQHVEMVVDLRDWL